jgi:hypothetical protein
MLFNPRAQFKRGKRRMRCPLPILRESGHGNAAPLLLAVLVVSIAIRARPWRHFELGQLIQVVRRLPINEIVDALASALVAAALVAFMSRVSASSQDPPGRDDRRER